MIYSSNSPKETENLARVIAKELRSGDVICLRGDLGAGKTAFVQGLVKALGVEEPISSPTFTIINCYNGNMPIYHYIEYFVNVKVDEMVKRISGYVKNYENRKRCIRGKSNAVK